MAYSLENTQDLTDLADAIRSKTGDSEEMTVPEMTDAVEGLSVLASSYTLSTSDPTAIGLGIQEVLRGIPDIRDKIGCINISGGTNASYLSNITYLQSPILRIGFYNTTERRNLSEFLQFCSAENIIIEAKEPNWSYSRLGSAFAYCEQCKTIDLTGFSGITPSTTNCYTSLMFANCVNLREIIGLSSIQFSSTASAYDTIYVAGFAQCISLDAIENVPVYNVGSASSSASGVFQDPFNLCCHVNKITFNQNNGVPYSANWTNSTLWLNNAIGYYPIAQPVVVRLPAEKEVTDATSYNLLKNDPDWWTYNVNYSRYNHDSAVETINSLPDCSQYGQMTIVFNGASGTYTDGGPISALTAAEIAVATAKGWTVDIR